jgi:hypothetical protein
MSHVVKTTLGKSIKILPQLLLINPSCGRTLKADLNLYACMVGVEDD